MERDVLEIEDLDLFLRDRGSRPLEVEIGCGNGHFLAEYAVKSPGHLFLGIDRKKSRCLKSINKVNHRSLANVFILYGRAESLVRRLPPLSVRAYHIYFPDPWPKNRHRRRRFFRMSQLEALCQTLEESGTIFFCSDYFDYYLQAKVLLALHGEFSLQEEAPPDDIFQSIFSRRFLAMGRELHFTSARRTLPGTAPGSGLTE